MDADSGSPQAAPHHPDDYVVVEVEIEGSTERQDEITPTLIIGTCAVVTCDNSEDLFPFPADNSALADKWLELCGRFPGDVEDLADLAICGQHFTEEDFGKNRDRS